MQCGNILGAVVGAIGLYESTDYDDIRACGHDAGGVMVVIGMILIALSFVGTDGVKETKTPKWAGRRSGYGIKNVIQKRRQVLMLPVMFAAQKSIPNYLLSRPGKAFM